MCSSVDVVQGVRWWRVEASFAGEAKLSFVSG